MFRSRPLLPAVAAVTLLALPGCGSINDAPAATSSEGQNAADGGEISTIVFDYPFTALPVYQVVAGAAQERADELGVTLEVTNDNMDLSTQVSNLNTWLARTPDAVVSFPMDNAAIESIARSYRDQGLIWVTYGGDLENQDASLQFSFYDSGYLLGEDAAAFAQEQLGGTGKVLVLEDLTIQLGQERTQGILDALAELAPGLEIVSQQQAVTPEEGLSVTTSVLAQHPDVDIVLAAVGDAVQGSYQALIASGRPATDANTYIGGLDGNLSLLQAMARGEFVRGLTTIDPVQIGNAVIDVPIAVAAGELAAGEVFDVPIELYTADSPGLAELITAFGG